MNILFHHFSSFWWEFFSADPKGQGLVIDHWPSGLGLVLTAATPPQSLGLEPNLLGATLQAQAPRDQVDQSVNRHLQTTS